MNILKSILFFVLVATFLLFFIFIAVGIVIDFRTNDFKVVKFIFADVVVFIGFFLLTLIAMNAESEK